MTCEKKTYVYKKVANKYARILTKEFWKKHDVYKCPYCDCFHLTTKTTIEEKEFFRNRKKRNLQNNELTWE